MSQRELIRVDHMTVQYVWALENEQEFVTKARCAAERGEFEKFRALVRAGVAPVRHSLGEANAFGITTCEWSFLYVELWCRMGGKDNETTDFHVDRLRGAGYELSEDGVVPISAAKKDLGRHLQDVKAVIAATDALVSNNPCAEIEPGQPQTFTLENEMSNQIIIANKTFINGADVADMSDEQLIDAIKRVEKEVEELKSVKTQSKKIAAKVEEATKTLTALVELLDGR